MTDAKKLYLTKPIAYLTSKDFDNNGDLTNPQIKDKTVIILCQTNWCGYCSMIKPTYQKLADKNDNNFVCATLQVDGERSDEKELNDIIKKVDKSFRGFPHIMLYKNGKYNKTFEGKRDLKSLEDFVKS